MTLSANTLLNDKSRIIAGGSLTGTINNLINTSATGQRLSTDNGSVLNYITHDPSGKNNDYTEVLSASYQPPATIQSINLDTSVFQQNAASGNTGTQISSLSVGSVGQTASGASASSVVLNNAANTGVNSTPISHVNVATPDGVGTLISTVSPNVTLPNNSLFHVNPGLGWSHYSQSTIK